VSNASNTSKRASWIRRLGPILVGILTCEGVGIVAGLTTRQSVDTWYPTLNQPGFTPPDWVFAPAWTLLYALMGIAAGLVWRLGWDRSVVREALGWFAFQLVLNASWTIAFFGLQSITGGLVVIVALWAAIAVTLARFYRLHRGAGVLLVPYLLWVTYAAALNVGLWMLN
jgi:tryptophan-rich sensory protein